MPNTRGVTQKHLAGGDLVMDVGQHVEHLAVVQHGGMRTQTTPNLLGHDLEINSQEDQWSRQHRGLAAHRWSLVEQVELTIAFGDVGQAHKVEDLARSEGAGHDEELTGEVDATV